ncbi:uncharacterized protein LOC143254159 isoform X2 [Tachypleus tridentatus]|uniref:uncharacterized protein LOC143254159 isoform X2 n=1 Tax=Tachypleus tridentatus TaxID=6853 RepID=UPI003FD5EAE4
MASTFQLFFMFMLLVVGDRTVNSRYLPKSVRDNGVRLVPEKRPFCNAFTGCGMKRSRDALADIQGEPDMSTLSRKIMAEARLWELLQQRILDNAATVGLNDEVQP